MAGTRIKQIVSDGVLKCSQPFMYSTEYEWILENFEPLISGCNIRRSPAFCPMLNLPAQFYFHIECEKTILNLNWEHNIFNIRYTMTLKSVGIIPDAQKVMIDSSVIGVDGQSEEHWVRTVEFLNTSNLKCFSFLKKRHLSTDDFVMNSTNNAVVIKCRLQFFEGFNLKTMRIITLSSPNCTYYAKDLANNLKSLLDNSTLSDLSLQMGQHTFKVHKVILAARSPVFRMMIEHECLESKSNTINIPEYNLEIFECFIKFLYTGDLPEIKLPFIMTLYQIADLYDVQSLQNTCSEIMATNITSVGVSEVCDNVCKILTLADQHSDKNLKETAVQFIVRHYADVIRKKDWCDLIDNYPQLASEVFAVLTSSFQGYFDYYKKLSS